MLKNVHTIVYINNIIYYCIVEFIKDKYMNKVINKAENFINRNKTYKSYSSKSKKEKVPTKLKFGDAGIECLTK